MRLRRSTKSRFRKPAHGRSALRVVLILLAVVLLVPVLAAIGALVFVDPDYWRPQIEAAVQQATGRTLRIGRLHVVPWFTPTLGATDLAFANLPGGSRPDMITAARAEVRLALLPLLAGRVEVARLLLVSPDILLERDSDGRPNWQLGLPPAAWTMARRVVPDATRAGTPPGLPLRAVRIEDGRLNWRSRGAAAPVQLDLRVLEAQASGWGAPITLAGQGAYAGQALAVTAETGPLSRLLDEAATTPWPVKATLETPGARVTATGDVARPLDGDGYELSVEGAAVNLSALDGLLAARLPLLRQVAFAARVVDAGRRLPEVTGLAVRAAASDLDALVPGLKLIHAEMSAASLAEPVRAEAVGSLRGTPVLVTASLGPLVALLPDPPNPGPYPVELAAEAAGATLAVRGGIAAPTRLSGIDLAVTGRIPDLAGLSQLAGTGLPALRPVTLDARVSDRAGTPGFAIRGLAVTAPEADVSGELVVGLGPRLGLQATLSLRRIDLDAVLAALPPSAAAVPFGAASAMPVLPASAPKPPAHAARLIPDDKLPFAALDTADADVRLSIGELRSGGVAYRDLAGRLLMLDGRLTLDPLSVGVPGGRLDVRVAVDSRAVPPPVALSLRGPGLSLKPLLAALRLPGGMTGTADIDVDLRSTGDTPQALVAGLEGRLGVAMPDGMVDNRLLGSIVGAVLTAGRLPGAVAALELPGNTRIGCLVLRADAAGGIATASTVLLDTSRILIYGVGTLNLRDEAIAMRLRPMLKGGVPVVVPVRLGGTLVAPKVAAEPAGSADAVAGLVAGLGMPRGTPLAALAAELASERDGDPCDPALAAVHAGPRQTPPKPPTAPADVPRGPPAR